MKERANGCIKVRKKPDLQGKPLFSQGFSVKSGEMYEIKNINGGICGTKQNRDGFSGKTGIKKPLLKKTTACSCL